MVGSSNALIIPEFKGSGEMSLDISKTKEADSRLVEARTVTPITYANLEHTFNESYRELKTHMATIGYQLALAVKALEQAKANVLLVKVPEYLEGRPKGIDNADLRKALMIQDQDYLAALDRIAMLKAMESFVEGRIKVMENVSRYMKKQMDLLIRGGLSNSKIYG